VVWNDKKAHVPASARRGISAETALSVSAEVLHPDVAPASGHALVHDLKHEAGIANPDAPARLLACSIGDASSRRWLCLGRHRGSDIFTSADHKLLSAVSALTAISLENVRLHRH
jgi:hypothetical protein